MNTNTHSAITIAEYFLWRAKGKLTPIQVIKLCYFTQGLSLAEYDEAIIYEPVLAWEYGPIFQSVYDKYKYYGDDKIGLKKKPNLKLFSEQQLELFDWVWNQYGKLKGFQMSNVTHREGTPWYQTYIKDEQNSGYSSIPNDLIREYYKDQIAT